MIRFIIRTARVISIIFTPFYLPILGLLVLFLFSYLSLLPLSYKIALLSIVLFFTALLPTMLIRLYRKYNGWTLIELGQREKRMVPYVISIASYICGIYTLRSLNIPHFIGSILTAAIVIQIVCAVTNIWWKISTHMAAIGGVSGALLIFGIVFHFNPLLWFSILMLLSGIVGSSRMILRQHSLSQVVGGYVVGFACASTVMML